MQYATAITPTMAELIDPADPLDPISLQFVPAPEELDRRADELDDPIGDSPHSPVEGIVHRYPDRVLLMPLTVCPVYCRFCFRRETVGGPESAVLPQAKLDAAIDYIRRSPGVWEVILSGGDPLILAPRRLDKLLRALRDIAHVKIIRIHTRVPLVDPKRVDDALLDVLDRAKPVYVALHANHVREFTPAGRAAVARLADRGVVLLGQTVLLKDVNDSVAALSDLMRCFVENRVKPYYLHQLDKAPGTARFRVPLATGKALVEALRGGVSGLCQPTYVLDIPGGHGKSPLNADYAEARDGEWRITDFKGRRHGYRD
ncbi:MAG: lysine-2,3-aminomutase-like protein [Pseudomonadota bacterium]